MVNIYPSASINDHNKRERENSLSDNMKRTGRKTRRRKTPSEDSMKQVIPNFEQYLQRIPATPANPAHNSLEGRRVCSTCQRPLDKGSSSSSHQSTILGVVNNFMVRLRRSSSLGSEVSTAAPASIFRIFSGEILETKSNEDLAACSPPISPTHLTTDFSPGVPPSDSIGDRVVLPSPESNTENNTRITSRVISEFTAEEDDIIRARNTKKDQKWSHQLRRN